MLSYVTLVAEVFPEMVSDADFKYSSLLDFHYTDPLSIYRNVKLMDTIVSNDIVNFEMVYLRVSFTIIGVIAGLFIIHNIILTW